MRFMLKMKWKKFPSFKKKKEPMKIIGPKPEVKVLPAQPSPSRFSSMTEKDLATKAARRVFGEAPEYMGMSSKSMYKLAAESKATKMENRIFFSTLQKERQASRMKTASGIKGKKLKVKTPLSPTAKQIEAGITKGSKLPTSKFALKVAKSRGAIKAYKSAFTKSTKAYPKLLKKYTGEAKTSMFIDRTKSAYKPATGFGGEKATETQAFLSMGLKPKGYFSGQEYQGRISYFKKGKYKSKNKSKIKKMYID